MMTTTQPGEASGPAKRTHVRAGLLAGLLAGVLAIVPAEAASPPPGLADVVAPLLPSVVSIRTSHESPNGRRFVNGSGFIITPEGLIGTNRHVIEGASVINVSVPGRDPLPAKPVYIAEYLDFALLKVDPPKPLPAVTLGDSDKMRIGDTVLVLGNPLSVGESLSVGVISALGRDIGDSRFDRFFQTDAAINHGNSGGPMFNIQGEAIGIDSDIYSSPGNTGSIGIGFALPINDVKFVIDQYLRSGKVVIGSTGARAQRMTPELAAAFGRPNAAGSLITEVLPGGMVEGKLQPGDILLRVGTQDASDTSALARRVVTLEPGSTFPVTFVRDGTERTVDITIGREEIDPIRATVAPAAPASDAAWVMHPSHPGFDVATIGPVERKRFGLGGGTKGVVVTSVHPHTAVAREVQAGDVILSINGKPIRQPADVKERLGALSASNRPSAALLITGSTGTRWAALPLQPDH